jgi:A/G-specific adenine glycosylase
MQKKEVLFLRQALNEWYAANHRDLPWRRTKNPYHIWVSEVMLQQTQVSTVLPYYQKFLQRFPDIHLLARANLQAVLKAWEGMGYYARARNLHAAAGMVLDQYLGVVPQNWQDFRRLPGVGDYIAAAVLSIAFDQPYPVVDGNVKRVISRLFAMEAPVNISKSNKQYQGAAADLLDNSRPGAFNQAVMELGALICRPQSPLCAACPIQAHCKAYRSNRTAELPRKQAKSPVPQYRIAVGVVFKNGRVLITRRKENGLLGGLWEFPGGKIRNKETSESACLREIKEEVNLTIKIDAHLCRIKHAYTHFKILMDVFCCTYASGQVRLKGPVDFRWISLENLESYPLPKANHKFLAQLRQYCEFGRAGDQKIRRSEDRKIGR